MSGYECPVCANSGDYCSNPKCEQRLDDVKRTNTGDDRKTLVRRLIEVPLDHGKPTASFAVMNALCHEAAEEIERLRKWEAEVIAALEGLPDNTAPDAIRMLRKMLEHTLAELGPQEHNHPPGEFWPGSCEGCT